MAHLLELKPYCTVSGSHAGPASLSCTRQIGSSMLRIHPSELQLFVAMRKNVPSALGRGGQRSIGRANQLAAQAAKSPEIFVQLIEALWHSDPVVRMRAADAAEKASTQNRKLLSPYKAALLGLLAEATQRELRWHLAQMIPRLELTREECQKAASALRLYVEDRSSIVRALAMQALADLAQQDESLHDEVLDLIRHLTKKGSPAMRARGRKLLGHLEHPGG